MVTLLDKRPFTTLLVRQWSQNDILKKYHLQYQWKEILQQIMKNHYLTTSIINLAFLKLPKSFGLLNMPQERAYFHVSDITADIIFITY